MNNRKINFEVVGRSAHRWKMTRPQVSFDQNMHSSLIISPKYQWASGAREIRKHAELAEPVDETFYKWSQGCPLNRYVVTLGGAQ